MADSFNIGDRVVKNPKRWRLNDWSAWGRGEGIGVIIEPPFPLQEDSVDVQWPATRSFEKIDELLHYEE